MDSDASSPPTAISPHGDEPAVMLHSSGTTGRPKLITKSHRSLLLLLRNMHSSMHDTDVLVSSWMHWLAGFCMILFAFIKSGSRVCWPIEDYTAPVQTIKRLLLETRPQIICCTAALLIPASKTAEGLGVLKECAMVVNLGGVLPPSVANLLTQNGVRLATAYDMTELPVGLSSVQNAGDPLFWDYAQPDTSAAPHLHFRPLREDEGNTQNRKATLYELVVLPSLPALEQKWANFPDGSLHTGDIFVKHPTRDSYRCLGRLTDQIRLTPNSTDVITLRARIYEDIIESQCQEHVDAAVIFGDERPRPVILLFVKTSAAAATDEYIRDKVWVFIENESALHSLLSVGLMKDMLVIVRDRLVPRTPKGDVIRTQVFLQFSDFIDSALRYV